MRARCTDPPPARWMRVPAFLPLCAAGAPDRERLAAHEAGHAIVAAALGLPVDGVRLAVNGGELVFRHPGGRARPMPEGAAVEMPPPAAADGALAAALLAHARAGALLEAAIAWMATACAGLAGERLGADAGLARRPDFDHAKARAIAGAVFGLVDVPLFAPALAAWVLARERAAHRAVSDRLLAAGAVAGGELEALVGRTGRDHLQAAAREALPLVDADAVAARLARFVARALPPSPRRPGRRPGARESEQYRGA